jgi:hypothetical protein
MSCATRSKYAGRNHQVKLAASTEEQSGSRAGHVTAKATAASQVRSVMPIPAGYGEQYAYRENRMWRSDVLCEAWKRVKKRRGAAGLDARSITARRSAWHRPGGVTFRTFSLTRVIARRDGQRCRKYTRFRSCSQIDTYVYKRLRGLRIKRVGRSLTRASRRSGRATFLEPRTPSPARHREVSGGGDVSLTESPPESRVREIREHGLYGGVWKLASTARESRPTNE